MGGDARSMDAVARPPDPVKGVRERRPTGREAQLQIRVARAEREARKQGRGFGCVWMLWVAAFTAASAAAWLWFGGQVWTPRCHLRATWEGATRNQKMPTVLSTQISKPVFVFPSLKRGGYSHF
ncbi:hypothetical protein CFC21_033520 [Triticum aestivum]|uniref:Uncharacterized protein n=2 Tax=Triticum aestivum TaxID=4565 RepID=A0A9R1F232_WHEAT|nr:hypothetical protein CFC21_033520 [Triticum aestivum]